MYPCLPRPRKRGTLHGLRPPIEAAESHAAILDAVYELLQKRSVRDAARALIGPLNGQLGKVLSELIAEGKSEPAILRELFDEHIRGHQGANAADIERGKTTGELASDVDPELIIDAVVGAIF